jgi:hypothetical protein
MGFFKQAVRGVVSTSPLYSKIRKMAYINVDIDLDDINTRELVDELVSRLKRWNSRKNLLEGDKKELKEIANEIVIKFANTPIQAIEVKTLDDKMKYDHLLSVWDKYTSAYVQIVLP